MEWSALTVDALLSGTRPRRPVAGTHGSGSGGIGATAKGGFDAYSSSPAQALVPIHPLLDTARPGEMSRAGARHPGAEDSVPSSSTDTMDRPEQLYATLNEYLQLEHKFQPRLCLPDESESGEVTIGARDGAAHVLRCLKVWFDLPADVLVSAINLFDRFLTKMKVRPCHVPCITVSCMNVALDEHAELTKQARTVSIEELVSVSQSACTWRDVARMSRVLADKLALNNARAVTPLHWLRLVRSLAAAPAPQESELVNLLEIAICDAGCANARMSELALVIVYHQLEKQLTEWARHKDVSEELYYLYEFAAQLQAYCNMSETSLLRTRDVFRTVLSRYEGRCAAPQRQRLVWRLSERTTGSESSESEETSDWPRSPVLPVYCSN
ncbi:Cyclin-G2 [Papilio xuthus]|uniref:Cyclin-G2 n=1 Tax=Papilio xuthus TaxID=66420 RepID=A0A194Q4P7_PAPXU|nr:Cyclin-G2 [Papilio xuthus]